MEKSEKTEQVEKQRFKIDYRIDTYRVDQNKIGKPSGLWQVMQEAACRQMEAQRPSYNDLLEAGQSLMLASVDISIPEEVYFGDIVEASSWPCPSSRATFLRNYGLWKDGKEMAFASTQWSLVDIESRKILRVDEADFTNYWHGEYRELIHGKFKVSKETKETLEMVGMKEVQYSDLDYNGHMNNTYYMDVLCNYIPELAAGTHRVCFVRVHYSKEAPLGDKLQILRSPVILLDDDQRAIYGEKGERKYVFQTIKADGELNIQGEFILCPVKR